jgi:hypothetical protein
MVVCSQVSHRHRIRDCQYTTQQQRTTGTTKAQAPDKRKRRPWSARFASAHQYARHRVENFRNPNNRWNFTCSARRRRPSPCLRSSLPRALRVSPSLARAAMLAWAEAALVLAIPRNHLLDHVAFGVRPLVTVESDRLFCKVASPLLCLLPFPIPCEGVGQRGSRAREEGARCGSRKWGEWEAVDAKGVATTSYGCSQ